MSSPRGKRKRGETRFLWITDPWDTLDHARDTTLRLAQEAEALGHESWWSDVRTLRFEEGRVALDVLPLRAAFARGRAHEATPQEFDSIHYRTDPPVDLAYLHPLQLLALSTGPHCRLLRAPRGGVGRGELVNPANVLFQANEKFESAPLREFTPPGVVTSLWEHCLAFGKAHRHTVLKPVYEAQSKGIELLRWDSRSGVERSRVLVKKATENFTRPILLQKFLPEIEKGEVRLWFLDGKLLAWVKKHPLENDFRVNLDRGSRLASHDLSARERVIARAIGAHLRRRGIRLAAVDLIGEFITDFNFTSPGLISLMEPIVGRNLARPIIEALARPAGFRRTTK